MKKRIYEKSIQNARIDLDLTTNKAKFSYPTKKLTKKQEMNEIFATLLIPYMLMYGCAFLIYSIITYDFSNEIINITVINQQFFIDILLAFLLAFSVLGPPLIISFVMVYWKRNLLRYYPKLGYMFSKIYDRAYVARFEKIKTKTVEIPLFKNVIIKYKATKECAKYLVNIKITEHPFMQIVTRKDGSVVRPNKYLWKAVFTFKKIPKTGRLDVYFI